MVWMVVVDYIVVCGGDMFVYVVGNVVGVNVFV